MLVIFLGVILSICTVDARIETFLHITDVHFDDLYTAGSDVDNLCHPSNTSNATSAKAGKFGSYFCDAPWVIVESAIQEMKEIDSDPDFILWTGDSASHSQDDLNWARVFKNIRRVTKALLEAFPDTIILPALGNHDTFPPAFFPDSSDSNSTQFYERYIEEAGWGDMLPQDTHQQFKTCGFYKQTLNLGRKVHVLVLNTNIYYHNLNHTCGNSSDPCGQFKWLRDQLSNQTAIDGGEKFIITAHVPPGYFERNPLPGPFFNESTDSKPDLSDFYNEAYVDIFSDDNMSKNVLAHFYGHVHLDSFRLFTSSLSGKASGVAFLAPSVTPLVWNASGAIGTNPGIRQYQISSIDGFVEDYWQYYLPLEKFILIDNDTTMADNQTTLTSATDAHGQLQSSWLLAYRASKQFNVSRLGPEEMYNLYSSMKADKSGSLFSDFYRFNNVNHAVGGCNDVCFLWMTCAIVNLRVADMNACLSPTVVTTITSQTTTTTTLETIIHTTFFPEVKKSPNFVPDTGGSGSGVSTSAVVVSIMFTVGIVLMIGYLVVRKYHLSRYTSQEFLLTDSASVFNYEGYSQLARP